MCSGWVWHKDDGTLEDIFFLNEFWILGFWSAGASLTLKYLLSIDFQMSSCVEGEHNVLLIKAYCFFCLT